MNETVQQARIELSLNAQKATDKLNELTKEAGKLTQKLKETEKGTKEYDKLEKKLNSVEKNMKKAKEAAFDVNKVLDNLSGATMKDLNKAIKEMNRQMQTMDRNSDKWKYYSQQVRRAKAELESINAESTKSESWLSRLNNRFNQWGAGIATAIAAFTGLTLTVQKFRQMAMEKESSQANLKALTGLDDNSIAWLTQQAEQLSTTMHESGFRVRQSSQEILDAYTLVGSAKPELLSNKEALNAVTIEAMRLAEAAKMDLNQAVDAVTLSMNQYGASADQAARYTNVMAAGSKFGSAAVQSVTTAVQKAGVAASTAGIPIEALVGSIETLAEKGIKDEIAGTGLKTFFLKLEGMSEDVRPSVVGLQTALENLNAKGMDSVEMQKAFGLEAYTVAQAMISGADKVKYYTEAVTGTNVAVEQASINSQTAEARMAQARNRIKEVGIELGQRLTPFIISTTKFTTLLMEAFTALIDACAKYKTTIIAMVATMTTLITVKKLDVIWTKAQTLWTDKLVASVRKLWAVIKANPYGVVVAAATALVGVITSLATKTSFAEESQKRLNSAMEEANSSALSEMRKLGELKKELGELKKGTDEYNEVKNKIIANYGKYYDGLAEEIEKVGLTEAAYKKLTAAINESYTARAYEKFKTEQMQAFDQEMSGLLDNMRKTLYDEFGGEKGQNLYDQLRDVLFADPGKYDELLKPILEDLSKAQKMDLFRPIMLVRANEEDLRQARFKYGIKEKTESPVTDNTDHEDADTTNSATKIVVKNKEYWEKKKAEAQAKLEALDEAKKGTKEWNKLEQEIAEAQRNINKYSMENKASNGENEELKKKLAIIEANLNAQLALEETAFLTGQKTEKEHLDTVKKLNEDAIKDKQDLYEKDSKEWAELEAEKTVKLQKYEQDMFRIQKKYEEDIQAFAAKYQEKTLDEKMQEELAMWDKLYDAREKKDETYYKIRNEIIKKFEQLSKKEIEKNEKELDEARKKKIQDLRSAMGEASDGYGIDDLLEQGTINPDKTDKFIEYYNNKKESGKDKDKKLMDILLPSLSKYKEAKKDLDKGLKEGWVLPEEYAESSSELFKEHIQGILGEITNLTEKAWSQISALMNAGSELMQANMDLEIAKINQRYDVQLQRAEGNEEETKKIEERKEAEIARVKNEYNKRQMKMQMAQTIATSAIAILNAWASAMSPAYAPANFIVGGILSGIIAAQTAIQIAALKKQQEAQAAGYYSGGYTSRTLRDTDPAGFVHGNEFVVNARAVRNPAIRPMLDFIDTAQRNNYISSITSADVAHAAGSSPASTTVINNNTDSKTLAQVVAVVAKLSKQLDQPIVAQTYITGKGGSLEANKLYDQMISNATK